MQFFPKTEKYVSLFAGGDNPDTVDKRNKLRDQIKANLIAAAANGKDLEGSGILTMWLFSSYPLRLQSCTSSFSRCKNVLSVSVMIL